MWLKKAKDYLMNSLLATLKEVKYTTKIESNLERYSIDELVVGNLSSKASFILSFEEDLYAFSQWVSPKRTRTFPYARVYDTLNKKNRITLIPFCKDEGFDGDRDFIQWDTVSLMSLLNVHVILGYYVSAQKNNSSKQSHREKITKQIYDYNYVVEQLKELKNYQSCALHWNLKQMDNLSIIAERTLESYRKINKQTGVRLHGEKGIKDRIKVINKNILEFKELSRDLAQQAQARENLTIQPKEKVIGNKACITLKNLLGGHYYLTVDECSFLNGNVFIIEKKHSARELFPSENDIKDSFIKMALFSNIDNIQCGEKPFPYKAVVGLTSQRIKGHLHSEMSATEVEKFFQQNDIRQQTRKHVLLAAIEEARHNNFGLFLINSAETSQQNKILSVF